MFRFLSARIIILLMAVYIMGYGFTLSSNSVAQEDTTYPNTPIGVTEMLFDSIAENDANKYLDSILPENRNQPNYFFYRNLVQGVFGLTGLGNMDAANISVSFTDMVYEEVYNDDAIAIVNISGAIRDLNLAREAPFAQGILVVNRDSNWLVDINNELPANISISDFEINPIDVVEFKYPYDEGFIKLDIPTDLAWYFTSEEFNEEDARDTTYLTMADVDVNILANLQIMTPENLNNIDIQSANGIPDFLNQYVENSIKTNPAEEFKFSDISLYITEGKLTYFIEAQSDTHNVIFMAQDVLIPNSSNIALVTMLTETELEENILFNLGLNIINSVEFSVE